MSTMIGLGFTDVNEVFNRVDADITARLYYDREEEFDNILAKLFSKTKREITQIKYSW